MTVDVPEPSDGSVESQAVEWLSRIRAGGETHREAFETWYMADATHADTYDALLDSWDKTARIGETEEARAWRAARARAPNRSGWTGRALAVAAALTLVVAVGAGVHLFGRNGASPTTELASRVGEVRTVILADGSRVTLDTDTVIHTAFTRRARGVYLERGRARFDVAHDAQRPFVVTADGGSVTAHGTLFDVTLIEGRVTVALLRGSVEVRKLGDPADKAGRGRMLLPGQSIGVSKASPLPAPGRFDRSDVQWTTGMLSFVDTPLSDAVATANRYSATKIRLLNRNTLQLRVTGRFPARDIDGFAASLAATFGLPLARDAAGNQMLGSPTS